jgi:hypothetical protein
VTQAIVYLLQGLIIFAVVASKGRNKSKTRRTIDIPISPELALALSSTPTGDLTYLVTDNGQAFTINGLGNKFRDWCDAA